MVDNPFLAGYAEVYNTALLRVNCGEWIYLLYIYCRISLESNNVDASECSLIPLQVNQIEDIRSIKDYKGTIAYAMTDPTFTRKETIKEPVASTNAICFLEIVIKDTLLILSIWNTYIMVYNACLVQRIKYSWALWQKYGWFASLPVSY